MEAEIAQLAADLAAMKAAAATNNTMLAETYYYLTIPLMVLIHAGFLAYEMGASRTKNVLSSSIKNILAFAFLVPTFYYVGWWIYWAMPNGIDFSVGPAGISGWDYAAAVANPITEVMGPHLGDNATGVFWGAFTLFAATTASIMSGAVIERIKLFGFIILAIALGAVAWVVAAAWGWHADGWLVTRYGYHDFGAAGVVHMVAGFFALGVLIVLGPRRGKFTNGKINHIAGHNMPLTLVGLMLIIVGFWGFLMACIIFPGEAWSWSTLEFSTIYGTPVTLSALSFNILMGFAGGIIGAWMVTRDPFWMMSGALAGIISCAAGLDLWWPPMAFAIGFIGACIMPFAAKLIESMRIDDAVGAVSVHGIVGAWGVIAVGLFASGYPALSGDAGVPLTSLKGQAIGLGVMFALGFFPGLILALILRIFRLLRVPEHAELAGLDIVKVPSVAYPEGATVSAYGAAAQDTTLNAPHNSRRNR